MVKIITDSAADFEKQELIDKDIICMQMAVTFGEKEYRENENLTKNEFYELLETEKEFPKTSQPAPFDVESIFKKIKESGDECVVITISSALSGTYQSTVLIKEMTEFENCYVVDSLNATAGEKILVDYAVKLRDEGKSAKEIAEAIEKLKDKVVLSACIDTLEYLYKGGRLSKTAYTVGTMANVKPVIRVSKEGKVEAFHKALSIRRGIKYICEAISKSEPDTEYPIYVVYSYNRKNGDVLAEKIRELDYEVKEENIISIGATIGAHIGKNACGYIYIEK